MTPETIKAILSKGDIHGSAFIEICAYYGVDDNDLGKITEEQAREWLRRKEGDNLGHSDNTCN